MASTARTANSFSTTAGKQEQQEGISGQVGGYVNYIIISLWIFIAFAGWVVALSCLSALQHYENDTGISSGVDGWAIKSNYPSLNSGRVFRLDWFILFYHLVVYLLVVIATITRVLPQARISVCGYLAIAAVLAVISADRLYNLSHFHISKAYYSSSRGVFAGFVISGVADFALLYMAGLAPSP